MTIWSFIRRGLGLESASDTKAPMPVRLIENENVPELIYAIGDIHGCHDAYGKLEQAIVADAASRANNATIVVLGDFVDRGPDTRGVIDRLVAKPPEGIERLVLSGNHEAMMAGFLQKPAYDHDWLSFGGAETLGSYGIDAARWHMEQTRSKLISYQVEAYIPSEHLDFIKDRPFVVRYGSIVFVHAGINRALALSRQSERDLLWKRPDREEENGEQSAGEPSGNYLVVHGHTPLKEVFVSPLRINLDTGAYAGGPLSAARFSAGQFDGLLSSAA